MSSTSFGEFVRLCAGRFKKYVITSGIVIAIVFITTFSLSSVEYVATTSIMLVPGFTVITISDQNEQSELTNKTAKNCIDLLKNSETVRVALERELLDYDPASFAKRITVQQMNESSTIRLTVKFDDSDIEALAFTKTYADVACETIAENFTNPAYTAKTLEQATIISERSRFAPALLYSFYALCATTLLFLCWNLISMSLDKTIHTHDRITRFTRRSVIAAIPSFERAHGEMKNAGAKISNSYRILRSAVKYSPKKPKSIAVCSPSPKDGRTSVAVGLATALAETNAMVALIEADLRRPSIKMQMRIDSPFGLADLLLGKTNLATTICKTSNRNLYVITASSNSNLGNVDIADLIDSDVMDELIEAVYSQFDYVIVDTPATEIVPDSTSISGKVDACIVVAKYGHTHFDELCSTIEVLEGTGADILGVVTVNTPVRSGLFGSVTNYYMGGMNKSQRNRLSH